MLQFSFDVIAITKVIAASPENKIITGQLIRSATSIGANYTEANNAASRQDFRNKIFIAKKEAAETRYWLRLFAKLNDVPHTGTLINECSELLFILQKIVSTLKNGK